MDEMGSLELVSGITELNDIHEFMNDEELDKAMENVVKLVMNPNLKPTTAALLIVELQAAATLFAIKATHYATIGKNGTAESHKKNVYYTMKEALTKLVDSLKYVAKSELYG